METEGLGPHRELLRKGRARLGEAHHHFNPVIICPSFDSPFYVLSAVKQAPQHNIAIVGSSALVIQSQVYFQDCVKYISQFMKTIFLM